MSEKNEKGLAFEKYFGFQFEEKKKEKGERETGSFY